MSHPLRCFLVWSLALLSGLASSSPSWASPRSQDEAAAISQVANVKAQAGEHRLCAELYQQAYRLDPAFLGYLYSAARCSQKAGNLDAAERDYRMFLARAPAGDPLLARAQENLDEIFSLRRTLASSSEQPALAIESPVTPSPNAAVATPESGVDAAVRRELPVAQKGPGPAVWAALGSGLAMAGAGGAFLGMALADRAALERDLLRPTEGLIVDVSPSQARSRDQAWQTQALWSSGLGAAGLAVAGVGVWLWATHDEVAVAVDPHGLRVAVSFR